MADIEQLAREIYQISYLQGEFTLRSGQKSAEYFDKYRFEAEPALLKKIAELMAPMIPANADYLAGLEMGGIPIATALSLITGKPLVFVRKQAKSYGTCQFAEGKAIADKSLCLVEDVITTGGQVVQSASDLRRSGALIDTVLCVIDRSSQLPSAISQAQLNLKSLFTMEFLKRQASPSSLLHSNG